MMTPAQVAARCEEWARVEHDGVTYRVYPHDRAQRPVFFSSVRIGSGAQYDNILRDLRASGIDITAEPAAPNPPHSAAPTTTEGSEVATPERKTVTPMATRTEVQDVREMVRNSQDTLTGLLADAEKATSELRDEVAGLRAEVGELRAELLGLRARGIAGPRPPSKAEILRGIILAYFETIPGVKLTPALVEANCDALPEGRGVTDVAGACNDLVKAGKLAGGPQRDKSGRQRGLYWFEPMPAAGDKQR